VEHRDIIPVEAMDASHAISLFEKKLGEQANREDMIQLSTALEFMPLAIVQAASYIKQREPRQSVRQYLERFRNSDRQKFSLLNYEDGHLRRDPEAKNAILATWQISFDYIRRKRSSATDLLSLMSFFDRQGIPDTLLRSETERKGTLGQQMETNSDESDIGDTESASLQNEIDKFEDDICILRDYSMISANTDGRSFGMHRLVQLAIQEWLKANTQLESWKEHFIRRLDSNFPEGLFENWTECQILFAHVQCAVTQRPCTEVSLGEWASLLHKAASFAGTRGDFINSERMARKATNVRKHILGPESKETLSSSGILGQAYELGGQWKKAEELQIQVMKTCKQVIGPEHPHTLTSIGNLALTFFNQGRWKEAEELQVEVMETFKRVIGLEHPHTLTSIGNLALTFFNQGRWKEAEELQVEVMEARKRLMGPEHPNTLMSMDNLALTFSNQGRWKEAEELQVEVMEARKRVIGLEHPDTLMSIGNLASTFFNQGRWKEAEELRVEVMETHKRVIGPEHPHTLMSMGNLASTFSSQGRWKEAEELQVEVMETHKRVIGPEHPHTLTSIAHLASTFFNQRRWKEAEELQVEVMETHKRVVGPEHPHTLTSIGNLALTLKSVGQDKTALQMMNDCARLRSQQLGPRHPYTLSSISTLNQWRRLGEPLSTKLAKASFGTRKDKNSTKIPQIQYKNLKLVFDPSKQYFRAFSVAEDRNRGFYFFPLEGDFLVY
jgi:tetratricopeptide (TPR) repeat protein